MAVWQKAREAMKEAYRLANMLPKHEQFAMGQQIRTSSLSMPGNIAEAFGRHHKKDKKNFIITVGVQPMKCPRTGVHLARMIIRAFHMTNKNQQALACALKMNI